eukprot:8577293-Pyramimonas_sp.AAC.1
MTAAACYACLQKDAPGQPGSPPWQRQQSPRTRRSPERSGSRERQPPRGASPAREQPSTRARGKQDVE